MKHLYISLLIFSLFLSCTPARKETKLIDHLLNPDYKLAYQFRENNVSDSSYYYYNKAKDAFLTQNDSLGAGKCLINMAIIATNQGDYFGGQELSLTAIPFFNEQNPSHFDYIRSNFNNLGIASSELKDFNKAINFYQKSLPFTKDSSMVLVIKNNIGNAYQNKKDYNKALTIYEDIIYQEQHPINYARTLSNYAYTKWLQKPKKDVSTELLTALKIRQEQKDILGECGSYNYLTNYYLDKKPDSALIYAQKMYEKVKQTNAPDDKLLALNHLVKLSGLTEAKKYFKEFNILRNFLLPVFNRKMGAISPWAY